MAVFVSGGFKTNSRTFVEYLESTGEQYIDMGFKPNQDTKIEITAEVTLPTTFSGNVKLFGARSSSSAEFFTFYYPSTKRLVGRYAATQAIELSTTLTGKISNISLNKNTISVDGASASGTYATFQCTHNAMLFGWTNEGTVTGFASMRLYSCRVYDNDKLIRDYWPCYDGAGVACLYDMVEKKYYYNQGTGEFIAGAAA